MIHEKSKTFFLQTGGVHCGYCTPFTLINMNLFVTPKTYKISGEKENSMGFFKDFAKGFVQGAKEGSAKADRRIAEKRAREAEREANKDYEVSQKLKMAKLAAEGKIKQSTKTDED